MKPVVVIVLAASVTLAVPAAAEPLQLQAQLYSQPAAPNAGPAYIAPQTAPQGEPVRYAASNTANTTNDLGGGLFEFLFGPTRPMPRPPADMIAAHTTPEPQQPATAVPMNTEIDPQFLRRVVPYGGHEKPGTIVIDTPHRFLYLVQENGTAVRYGIGVGKPGFEWAGVKAISAKKEWPDWVPPPEMLQRRPDLPAWMAGGPENPLGARALYLGSSLYRIHGSNEPWTIGQAVSSGCIRMRNEDVIDLYERVKIGTKVVVI